ncbi:MAG: hypothetical protein GWP48_08410 [Actinobacteria bacterium]|nr:hypothetical protein [Actinomycetota bacterium]
MSCSSKDELAMAAEVQQLTGTAHLVANLLRNNRFGLDLYQCEFMWEETQVGELIDDLSTGFDDEFDESHSA